jgi:hypothetical protein
MGHGKSELLGLLAGERDELRELLGGEFPGAAAALLVAEQVD